jgi:hypothetical protein
MNYSQKIASVGRYLMQAALYVLACLIVLELFVRFFIIQIPPKQYVDGLGVVPGDHSRKVWGLEGFGVTHYLAQGEVYTPRQTGRSVVIFGDSYTEAYQVSDADKYVSVAEEALWSNGQQVDLHNIGYSDRSVADYIYAAPHILQTYDPEVVVIQLNIYNFAASLFPSRQNYLSQQDATLVLNHDSAIPDLRFQRVARQFGLLSFLSYRFDAVNKSLVRYVNSFRTPAGTAPTGLEQYEDVENLKQQLGLLRDAYQETTLVILVIPSLPVIAHDGSVIWSEEKDELLLDAMVAEGISFIYPREAFVSLYEDEKKFSRGFFNTSLNYGHLNVDGNHALGVALADYLDGVLK